MGDRNRITKTYEDTSFVRLMHDMDTNKVKHDLKPCFVRPAYAYTKASVGGYRDDVSDLSRADNPTNV